MRQTSALFNAAAIFFLPVMVIYGIFTKWTEPVGLVALTLLGFMGLMVGMYLRMTMKKLDRDPADDPRGEQWMQEGEYGFFSPHSWWPLPLAVSAIIVFLGLRLGLWVFLVGVVFGAVALIGWAFEYYREDMVI
ncbi:cytochrome c oxidase subunit 4 [Mobilicoccus pelagius]|uniref:Cytochrome c oxidase polypeptide 4 n=1 Tax=Mobilicoccus pelagius NBRC 104925 TaxID=1089455 RepID=H5UUU4_9MICO|nr:cytochrome c oxidase subunit 4 [Mobilicoccus pelagius]GAB49502.1 cytochrome c oxidase subunit IV [Mobilicoccus pelagius NBRC 104925]